MELRKKSAPGIDHASLADARWQRSIPNPSDASPLNCKNTFRLFGDETAEGTVSGTDFLNFGNSISGPDIRFDFDNDGVVSGADLLQFGNHFGVTV